MAGYTYIMEAVLSKTAAYIDDDKKPAILTAITKYHVTENARQIAADAMDIQGGKGICLGPNNYLGRFYEALPICITVEGANILTRNLMIFGQGALRAHHYILTELNAVENSDKEQALRQFDRVIFAHLGAILSHWPRALVLGLTAGRIARVPKSKMKLYYQQLTRFSSAFALIAEITLITVGGELKRKENLSARLGDILSGLYLASAVLKHFYDEGEPEEDKPLVDWCCQRLLFDIQSGFDAVLNNHPKRWIAKIIRGFIFPLGQRFKRPKDQLSQQVARSFLKPSTTRQRLTADLCVSEESIHPLGRLEKAFEKTIATHALQKKIKQAVKAQKISALAFEDQCEQALQQQLITQDEYDQLMDMHQARMAIIHVDDFAWSFKQDL
jgi:acyl-CoA dehydrogenase